MSSYKLAKLGEVCDFVGGSQPPKAKFVYDLSSVNESEYVRLIQIRDYKSDKHIVYITKKSTKKFCNKDDVMIGRYGPPVFQILEGLEGAYNVALMKAIPKEEVLDRDFLFRFLESPMVQSYIITLSERAAGQTGVNKQALHDYPIPLPSLDEQKRIVATVDKVLVDIEQARAKTEQNLKNARGLFESYLQQVFGRRGEGWGNKKVSEIADTCLGKMLDKKKNKGSPKPYLRNLNVQWFAISTDDLLEMRFEDSEHERYAIKKGDLVLCEGGYPGRGAIWSKDEDIFFQKALHRVRCHNAIYNRWVLYYLFLNDCDGSLKSHFTGAGIQHFTGKALKQLALPIPPESVAKRYLEKIDALHNEVKLLESVYEKKLYQLDELKKSILQKAFSGELAKNNKGVAA